ncbi:MAG: DUF4382 domain-containing protein [Salinisphaera sp.]|jgi:hypothetical protein|nr:DUF4382 domain-containing protein [Salinisphaera sp.]
MTCKLNLATLLVAAATVLTACGGGGNNSPSTTLSSTSASSTGSVSLAATDAPVDGVSQVQVTFDAIGLKPHGKPMQMITLDTPDVISNLLDLTDGNASPPILDGRAVPAGQYDYIRLYIAPRAPDSFVVEDNGGQHDLLLPGQQANNNAQRFLQLNTGFTVPAGGTADFTIDFQLRKALVKAPGQKGDYFLRPSLRLINNVEAGTIKGTVADSLVQDASCSNDLVADKGDAVYLYAGNPQTLGDVYINSQGQPVDPATNPLVTAEVKQNPDTGAYEFTLGFVKAGAYTLAFTCQALADQPETADSISLIQSQTVTVKANTPTTVNFIAPSP